MGFSPIGQGLTFPTPYPSESCPFHSRLHCRSWLWFILFDVCIYMMPHFNVPDSTTYHRQLSPLPKHTQPNRWWGFCLELLTTINYIIYIMQTGSKPGHYIAWYTVHSPRLSTVQGCCITKDDSPNLLSIMTVPVWWQRLISPRPGKEMKSLDTVVKCWQLKACRRLSCGTTQDMTVPLHQKRLTIPCNHSPVSGVNFFNWSSTSEDQTAQIPVVGDFVTCL